VSAELVHFLESKRITVVRIGGSAGLEGEKVSSVEEMKADLIVVVGGDGTVLRASQFTKETPLFGVKVGALGFLCETTPKTAKGDLEKVLSGRFYLDFKSKLSASYKGKILPDVLNEVLVATSKPSRIMSILLKKDGAPIHKGKADGVIVSTCTGSTAYALSAGGPIVDPQMDIIEVVFICPLSAGLRPLVFPCSSKIEITVLPESAPGMVILDGQTALDLDYEAPITIQRSIHPAVFARVSPPDFYGRIREKIQGLEV
jgi:NAD+ kinase